MDIASIIGIVLCFALIIYGIVSGEQGFAAINNFIDLPSVYITLGGSFSVMLASYSLKEYVSSLKSITLIFKAPKSNTSEIIKKIIDLSNVARKEGLLSLEEAAGDLDDEFLRKGILLIVDGTDPAHLACCLP